MCTGKNLARIYNTALHLYWKTSISAYIWTYYLQIHFDSFKFADANHAIWVKCCRLDDATEYNERKRQRIYICVCVHQETQPNYFDFMPKVPKYGFYSDVLITFRIPTEQV